MRKLFHELAKPTRKPPRRGTTSDEDDDGEQFQYQRYVLGKEDDGTTATTTATTNPSPPPGPERFEIHDQRVESCFEGKDDSGIRAEASVKRELKLGLQGSSSINDKTIPTFSRGELPHFAGINTFMKAPYCEDISEVGKYGGGGWSAVRRRDGHRPGTRFGPQGLGGLARCIRRITTRLGWI